LVLTKSFYLYLLEKNTETPKELKFMDIVFIYLSMCTFKDRSVKYPNFHDIRGNNILHGVNDKHFLYL